MTNCLAFNTQLASIMEVLANAAVAEICKLVDDGYAVLHLEISQSQKENENLKRKLKMMELRAERNYSEKTVRLRNSRSCGVQVCDDLSVTANEDGRFPTAVGAFGNEMDIGLWRDREATVVGEDDSQFVMTKDQSADINHGSSESLLIKEESLDEDLEHTESQGGMNIIEQRALGTDVDGMEKVPIVDIPKGPTKGVLEQHRSRPSVWEDSGVDTYLKTELENETVNQRLQHTGSEQSAGRLSYEYDLYEKPGQLEPFYATESGETETGGLPCSYVTDADPASLSGHSELPPISVAGNGEMLLAWNKASMLTMVHTQHNHYKKHRQRDLLPPTGKSATFLPNGQNAVAENVASKSNGPLMNEWPSSDDRLVKSKTAKTHRVDAQAKLFICTYCGKGLACLKNLKTHQRVHTGEKPFSCTQCGKRFADSSNFKRHQSVHTGERRYSCSHCGKRFGQSGSLKVHQRVHTGQKQFICSQCGKSFISSSHLKRHVSVHIGEKLLASKF